MRRKQSAFPSSPIRRKTARPPTRSDSEPQSMNHRTESMLVFFNVTATTEIYTLSLHDARPICPARFPRRRRPATATRPAVTASLSRDAADQILAGLGAAHDRIAAAMFAIDGQ